MISNDRLRHLKEHPYAEVRAMAQELLDRRENLEERVQQWIIARIGAENAHRRERAMRIIEEAVELAQAEGITEELVCRQAAHVFARPPGEPSQEAAGVAITLLGWCAATGHRLTALAARELERIEAKPLDQIRGSLARKQDADLIIAPEAACSKSE